MSDKLEHLNEIIEFQFNDNISKGIEHLDLITNSLFKLTQSLYDYNEKPKYHLRELEEKYFRFGLANQSIIRLLNGNRFKLIGQEVLIVDIFSFKALTRMQIESFLVMFYLFFDNKSDEEMNFRFDIYKIHGLQKQLNFKINFDTPNARKQKFKMEEELRQALENMKSSSFFINANEKNRKNFLKPRFPKLVESKDLFEASKLSRTGINQIWQLYSNYAHAEHISDRQYNTTYNITKSFTQDQSMIITINLILTAKLSVNIAKIFNGAQKEFECLSEKEKTIINMWNSLNK